MWTLGFLLLLAIPTFADDVVLPDGKAKKLVEQSCSDCHGLETVVDRQMSAADWRSTVTRMVRKGAGLSPAEVDSVVEYLSVYFAPDKINVNTATAQQLNVALQFSPAEADAIVKYRTEHGNFKDVTDLQKVSGIDAKKIEAKKDQLAF